MQNCFANPRKSLRSTSDLPPQIAASLPGPLSIFVFVTQRSWKEEFENSDTDGLTRHTRRLLTYAHTHTHTHVHHRRGRAAIKGYKGPHHFVCGKTFVGFFFLDRIISNENGSCPFLFAPPPLLSVGAPKRAEWNYCYGTRNKFLKTLPRGPGRKRKELVLHVVS